MCNCNKIKIFLLVSVGYLSLLVCYNVFLHPFWILYLQVMFQYMVRHSPLRIEDIVASINLSIDEGNMPSDVEIVG